MRTSVTKPATPLRLGPALSLPLDAVTETFWWSGIRGSGKSHDCSVFVEELLTHGAQVVVIDPMRAWWGLRSSSDGMGPGLPIPLFGGPRGDVPLETTAGSYMADLAVGERVSMVLDVKEWSKEDRRRFVTAFLKRLLQRNSEPIHLVVEETPLFAPQKPQRGDEIMLGVVEEVVRLGRGSGIGFSAISQRSAHLNAEIRGQIEVVVAHRTAAPLDRMAVKAWFDVHDPDRVGEAMARLPFLPTGTAIVSSTDFLSFFGEVAFRKRATFDSSATPKVGQSRREARTLADVDMGVIKDAMAETIERAKADDPKELRRRIAALERQVAHPAKPVVERVEVPVEVEVPMLDHGIVENIEEDIRNAAAALASIGQQMEQLKATVEHRLAGLKGQPWTTAAAAAGATSPARGGRTTTGAGAAAPTSGRRAGRPENELSSPGSGGTVPTSGDRLDRAQRAILTVLAQHGPRTHGQVALQTGYSAKASTIGVAVSKLRRLGYMEPGQPLRITQAGVEALGEVEPLPAGDDLLNYWRQYMGGGAERKVLDVLVERYPDEVRQEELAELAGYSPTASTIGVAMSKLRKLGLAYGWAASEDFMAAIA